MSSEQPTEITELYAIIGKDGRGNEGIASAVNPRTRVMEPLIGGFSRIKTIIELAQAGANESGMSFQLVKFTGRVNLDPVNPRKDDVGKGA